MLLLTVVRWPQIYISKTVLSNPTTLDIQLFIAHQ